MILFVIAIVLMVLLSGLAVITGAEFEQEVKAFTRRVKHLLARRRGVPAAEAEDPAREVAESARRMPPRLENAVAAGAAPVNSEAGAVPPMPSFTPSALLTTGELAVLDAKLDATLRRPVNGRSLGDQPRIATPEHPPWMTAPMPKVPAPDIPAAAWDAGDFMDPPVALARPYLEQARAEYFAGRMAGIRDLTPAKLLEVIDELRAIGTPDAGTGLIA